MSGEGYDYIVGRGPRGSPAIPTVDRSAKGLSRYLTAGNGLGNLIKESACRASGDL